MKWTVNTTKYPIWRNKFEDTCCDDVTTQEYHLVSYCKHRIEYFSFHVHCVFIYYVRGARNPLSSCCIFLDVPQDLIVPHLPLHSETVYCEKEILPNSKNLYLESLISSVERKLARYHYVISFARAVKNILLYCF